MSENKTRLNLIDTIRGITIVSMIGFHACWFLSYFGMLISPSLLYGTGFTIWERTICCTFIFISGFSFSLGHRNLKRGVLILGLGIAITILSVIFVPDVRDVFGVLWLLGISQLLLIPLDKVFKKANESKISSILSFILCIFLFTFTYHINDQYIGYKAFGYINMPSSLYKGYVNTLIGFTESGFYSVDYFSILPWFFLFLGGYFFHKITLNTYVERTIFTKGIPVFEAMGKKSLIIYLIHPVVLFIAIYLIHLFVV